MTSTPDRALVTRLQRRVDDHFDRMAEIIEGSASRSRALLDGEPDGQSAQYPVGRLEAHLRAAQSAHEALARRTRAERLRLADHVEALRQEHADIVTHLEAERLRDGHAARAQLEAAEAAIEEHRRRADALGGELAELRATKTFRYLDAPRRVYGRLLRRLR
jgi:hypothetical protein